MQGYFFYGSVCTILHQAFLGDGWTCQALSVWAYNHFWPILPKIWTWFYSQTTPKLVGAWHPKSPSGTYALTKFFRLTNKLMMRPMTTISSIASLTTSAITVPKPLMMAQSSRKYSINISIVLSFLSLKVSANRTKYQIYLSISEVKPNLDEIRVNHFLRDNKGFRCLSADFNAIFLPDGTTLCRLSHSPSVFFSLNAETQIFR